MSERSEPRTDAIPVTQPHKRGGIAKFIRTFALPIIVGWIVLTLLV